MRVRIALPVWLCLSAAAYCQTAARQTVLLLLPDPPGRPNSTLVLEGVQSTLREADPGIALVTDYISQEGQDRPEFVASQLAWYHEKYRDKRFDAIIVLGPETLLTLMRLREGLWPGAPVVFCGGGRGRVEAVLRQPGVTGTFLPLELTENLKIIRRLLPDTERVAIVGGSSAVDRGYNARVPTFVREVFPGIEIVDLTQLPLTELKKRLAALPSRTAVLIANFFYDPDGHPVFRRELVASLSPVTSAPLFSAGDIAMGAGIVGGDLTHYSWVGARAAEIALRVLRGEKPESIPIGVSKSSSLQFDWRELSRWRIPLDRLPPGSEILYKPFSIWSEYWWAVLLALAGVALETALVTVLLIQRRRERETVVARQRAEREIAAARDEISHLNRTASLGELAASLAHELNQPLAGILSNAQAARRFLAQPRPDLDEVQAALGDICDDNKRAGEIIGRMRQMLRKERIGVEEVDVNAAVRETAGLLHSDAILRRVSLEVQPAADCGSVLVDAVQLRQVILNLLLNAMEAAGENGRVVVRTQREAGGDGIEILVGDSGPGVPERLSRQVFEPFYSTKKEGLGMGLSISSSIVTAMGGRISVANAELAGLPGATFRIVLPALKVTGATAGSSH